VSLFQKEKMNRHVEEVEKVPDIFPALKPEYVSFVW
jgi:hypothetical protein